MVLRPSPSARDGALVRLAASQFHVVAARQLAALAIHSDSIARRVRAGILYRIVPCVYSVGVPASQLDRDAWSMAAVLRHRQRAAVAGPTAAARHGIWDREPTNAIIHVVTTGQGDILAPRRDVRILTRRSRDGDLPFVRARGIPTTDVVRTLVDCGRTHHSLQVAAMIDRATYREVVEVDDLRAAVSTMRGRPGVPVLRRAIELHELGSAGTRSNTEDELVRLLEASGVPEPAVNVRGATGIAGLELDFVWARQRLVVEVDGRHHHNPGIATQDAQRDATLLAMGWRVMRFAHTVIWNRPMHVLDTINRALAGC